MASKKKGQQPVKYCRIHAWLEGKDEQLAEVFTALCMTGALTPRRGLGVTFLYPGKKVRDKIIDLAYSEEAERAIDYLRAHILPEAYDSVGSFMSGEVGSLHGVRLKPAGSSPGRAKFEGFELEAEPSFRALVPREKELAVWAVASGEVPLEGESYKLPKPKGGKKPRFAEGGAEGSGGDCSGARAAFEGLVRARFCSYLACRDPRTGAPAANACDPYIGASVTVLNGLATMASKGAPGASEALASVREVLDEDPCIFFYLALEPFKTAGAHRVPDELVHSLCKVYCLTDGGLWRENAVAEYQALVAGAPAPVSNRAEMIGELMADFTPKTLDALREKYATVYGPAATARLWQHEFCFLAAAVLCSLRSGVPADAATDLNELVALAQSVFPGNDKEGELMIAKREAGVMLREKLFILARFINSSDCFHTAGDASAMTSYQIGTATIDYYNRDAVSRAHLSQQATRLAYRHENRHRDPLLIIQDFYAMGGAPGIVTGAGSGFGTGADIGATEEL